MESNPYTSPSANLYGTSSAAGEGVSQLAITHLQRTKPWVQFMSVMFFLGAGLMIILAAFMLLGGVVGAAASGGSPEMAGMQAGFMIGGAVVYGLLGFLYIYPAIKLWKYGARIGDLARTRSSADLETALDQQRAVWKFAGILTIIMIVIWVGAMITMMVVGVGMAGAMGNQM